MKKITSSSVGRRALQMAACVITATSLFAPGLLAQDAIPAPADVAAPPADAETTASGLASKVLEPGDGDYHPRPYDIIQVHYTGWTADGEMFDTSRGGEPVGLRMNQVIEGWREGIGLMVKGETRRLWIPAELAYAGQEGKPQGMLTFDIELLRYNRLTPPPAPENVAGPPVEAEVTESGLASIVLEQGDGTETPKARSTVTVHYTGWTTDGQMFDSSIPRGNPVAFSLSDVIKGWREGLQLMVAGEHRRFWIPEKLAYKGQKGKPEGMLVFDVELLAFGTN